MAFPTAVVCATDSELYAQAARHYGAEVPFLRSAEISGDKSPDIEWVEWMLGQLRAQPHGRAHRVSPHGEDDVADEHAGLGRGPVFRQTYHREGAPLTELLPELVAKIGG